MCQLVVDIPNEVLYDTKMSKAEALSYVKQAVAMSYYVKNGVSLGYCAQIADMEKEEFIKLLGANGISIFKFDDKNEFLEELKNA